MHYFKLFSNVHLFIFIYQNVSCHYFQRHCFFLSKYKISLCFKIHLLKRINTYSLIHNCAHTHMYEDTEFIFFKFIILILLR